MSQVCVNPNCKNGMPHWKGFGKPGAKCPDCGQTMRRIEGEPRGTKHGMVGGKRVR